MIIVRRYVPSKMVPAKMMEATVLIGERMFATLTKCEQSIYFVEEKRKVLLKASIRKSSITRAYFDETVALIFELLSGEDDCEVTPEWPKDREWAGIDVRMPKEP